MRPISVATLSTALGTVVGLALLAAAGTPAMAASSSPAAPLSRAGRSANAAAKPPPKRNPAPAAPSGPQTVRITAGTPSNCQNEGGSPAQATSTAAVSQTPWAQKALDFEDAWAPGNEGAGVLVAVVDSGVDVDSGEPGNPQLAGRVREIDLTGEGLADCDGHGTAVAGIIAASDQIPQGNAFAGVAPKANILSVKVTVGENFNGNGNSLLAEGIVDAAELGARVISVSVQGSPSTQLHNAVTLAGSKGAVIVAAGGNDDQPGQPRHGPYYPASYAGVLSVGAVEQDGSLAQFSDLHSNVQVTAPGVDVTSTWPGGYQTGPTSNLSGTSFATPFVAGVAALVIASHPGLSAQGVIARIVDTADGTTGPGTGAGMVNPLQAVTAVLPPAGGPASGPARVQKVPVARAVPADPGTRDASLAVTLGSLGAAVLVIAGGLVIGPGRRRRWRAGAVGGPGTEAASAGPDPATAPADPSDVLGASR